VLLFQFVETVFTDNLYVCEFLRGIRPATLEDEHLITFIAPPVLVSPPSIVRIDSSRVEPERRSVHSRGQMLAHERRFTSAVPGTLYEAFLFHGLPNDLPFSSERQGRVQAYHGREEPRAPARGVAAQADLRA
jgi:hypothetical protein